MCWEIHFQILYILCAFTKGASWATKATKRIIFGVGDPAKQAAAGGNEVARCWVPESPCSVPRAIQCQAQTWPGVCPNIWLIGLQMSLGSGFPILFLEGCSIVSPQSSLFLSSTTLFCFCYPGIHCQVHSASPFLVAIFFKCSQTITLFFVSPAIDTFGMQLDIA